MTIALLVGCGGYAHRSEEFRKALTRGQPEAALSQVNSELGVGSNEALRETDADTPLLLLERATINQALGRYEDSARDFQTADKNLDILDLTNDTAGNIAKYLFSDDATVYKAPAYEKLLLNTVNMINYLVMQKPGGAKVEARRFVINRKFVSMRAENDKEGMLALGSYLSGIAFEMGGQYDEAMRHYADAYTAGGVPTLLDAMTSLNRRTGAYDSRLKDAFPNAQERSETAESGVVYVIVQSGMAPYRFPDRMPIGAAVVASSSRGHHRLSPKEQQQANRYAAKGIVKWVNYPKLKRSPLRPSGVEVFIGQGSIPSGVGLDVEASAEAAYNAVKGSIIAAALVRMLTRAVAGTASEALAGGRSRNSGDNLAAFLIGLAVEGTMTAADTPDTRSWVTLPGRFYLARARVRTGQHQVRVRIRGRTLERSVEVGRGDIKVINFSALR